MTAENVRQAQVIAPNGVGAIFDVSGESFVVESTDSWFTHPLSRPEISSPRLKRLLRIDRFVAPPAQKSGRFGGATGPSLPVLRFPTWLFCGSCRRMVQWKSSMEGSNPNVVCPDCKVKKSKQKLVPMRWIQVCRAGHLGDVDWVWYTHASKATDCRKRDGLRFLQGSAGVIGLASVEIRCDHCGASRSLAGISDKAVAIRIGLQCVGRHPWEWFDGQSGHACHEEPLIVQRRASNVYYPEIVTAIEVPSTGGAAKIPSPLISTHKLFRPTVEAIKAVGFSAAAAFVSALSAATGTTPDEVSSAVLAQLAFDSEGASVVVDVPATNEQIAESEWAALTRTEPFNLEDFVTRSSSLPRSPSDPALNRLSELIPQITLVDTLREVRVFRGFRRVSPDSESKYIRADGRLQNDTPKPTWLPAIEVFGEGVFLRLDDHALQRWEQDASVVARVDTLDRRARSSFMWDRLHKNVGHTVSPRYVLLHTLGHLLMRRLSFESGYGASSLRERIFARAREDGENRFGGLLIYTAAGDAEGTLGGLVRQGEPQRLTNALLGAIDDAQWCSSDPLCSEQHAVSLDGLNLASCHACTLVSETSCENGNFLLDRSLVVGSETVPGFFSPILHEAAPFG